DEDAGALAVDDDGRGRDVEGAVSACRVGQDALVEPHGEPPRVGAEDGEPGAGKGPERGARPAGHLGLLEPRHRVGGPYAEGGPRGGAGRPGGGAFEAALRDGDVPARGKGLRGEERCRNERNGRVPPKARTQVDHEFGSPPAACLP